MLNDTIKLFNNQGFCLIKKNFFHKDEISKIRDEIKKTLAILKAKNHNDTSNIAMAGKSVLIRRITEHSDLIFDKINNLVQNKEIKFFLKGVLGPNYKITEIIYRHSEPGDSGLGIHQDADNEHTMVINLNDTDYIDGSTIFLKKSHNFYQTIDKIFPNNNISVRISNKLIFLFNWIKGKSGDIGFFSNRVWHGRACNKKKINSESILIGFYPSGSKVKFWNDYIFFSENYFKKNSGKELADRQNFNLGTELIDNQESKTYIIKNNENLYKPQNNSQNYFSLKFLTFLIISKILYIFKKNN